MIMWECGNGCGRLITDEMYRAAVNCGGTPPVCICNQMGPRISKTCWTNWIKVAKPIDSEEKQ
jgi:hypothetical protein